MWWERQKSVDLGHDTVNQVKRLRPSVACEDSVERDTQTETEWEGVRSGDNKQGKMQHLASLASRACGERKERKRTDREREIGSKDAWAGASTWGLVTLSVDGSTFNCLSPYPTSQPTHQPAITHTQAAVQWPAMYQTIRFDIDQTWIWVNRGWVDR